MDARLISLYELTMVAYKRPYRVVVVALMYGVTIAMRRVLAGFTLGS